MLVINIKNKYVKSIYLYILAIILSFLILSFVIKLWHADLTVPFNYGCDAVFSSAVIKGITDNGWFLNNRFLGTPFVANMYDFPVSDGLTLLLVKILSLLTSNFAVIFNLVYLLTYILTTVSALYVLRIFGISKVNSLISSLLFAFLPYHFFRGEGHFFLSVYFQVPLIVMVLLWLYSEEDFLFNKLPSQEFKKIIFNKKSIIAILICLLASGTGVYYAFFACFFLLIAGTGALLIKRKVNNFLTSLILVTVIALGVLLNISPNLLYLHQHGANTEVAHRNHVESEIYGLKITQLLLPVSGHRITSLADKKARYNSMAPLVNENDSVSLGVVGSIGFIFLIAYNLFGMVNNSKYQLFKILSILNLAGVLLATIGGFGTLFALVVSPEIRAYNRIIVYIAFFSLFAVALLIDEAMKRLDLINNYRYLKYILPFIVLIIGIYDQTTIHYVPDYSGIKREFNNDAKFVGFIENSVPPGSMIFQLPYVPFPENPPVNKMIDYDLFRGYLHSHDLRWTYGTIKGRNGDAWYKEVSKQPANELLKTISFAGFNGIYIDRFGYKDGADSLISQLSRDLGTQPVLSENKRMAFFNMIDFNNSLKERYAPAEYEAQRDIAIHPLLMSWEGGFSVLEGDPSANWRWCSSSGILEIDNLSNSPKIINIQMSIATGYPDASKLVINGKDFVDELYVNNISSPYNKTISVPPGEYMIKFTSDAKRVYAPNDPRYMVFRVENFKYAETIGKDQLRL